MCKRTSNDPLLRTFWRLYGVNLLQVPREDAAIGDVYVVHGDRVLPPGRITDLLLPPPRLPRVHRERLADLGAVVSNAVSLESGLRILEPFLAGLGVGSSIGQIRLGYQAARARQLRFRVEDARREYIDIVSLGRALADCTARPDNLVAGRGFRHLLTVGVVRAHSITLRAESERGGEAQLRAHAALLVEVAGSLTIEQRDGAETVYRGARSLAIGVELVELELDGGDGRLRIRPQRGPRPVKGIENRVLVGSPDGDALMSIG